MAARSITAGAGRMIFAVAQGRDDAGDDRLAAIGAPGGLRRGLDHEGQIGVARRPQPKRRGEDARMVGHRLRPAGVIGERGGRNVQLRRQPVDQGVDRLIHLRQRRCRDGEAAPVARQSPGDWRRRAGPPRDPGRIG